MNIENGETKFFPLDEVKIEQQREFSWKAFLHEKEIATFSFSKIKGKVWFIYGMVWDYDHRQKGIGAKIIAKAIEVYGSVYFCKAGPTKLVAEIGEKDNRYLTSEGSKFVGSCIQKGIIREEWYTFPDR